MEFKILRIKKNCTIMKENDNDPSKETSKDFPILKIIVFSIWAILIYCIYYLVKYGV